MKKQIRVSNFKSEEKFNVGDSVNIFDGSALSCVGTQEDVYIVFAYPHITGTTAILKDLTYKITSVNVTDSFLFASGDWGYLQDIEMEYNGVKFKTASGALRKAKLSDLKKQAEPKEGEWWYWEGLSYGNAISKTVKVDDFRVHFTELYTKDELILNDWYNICFCKRPATTEEITYFMGLHAERLGIKEGVTVDRSKLNDHRENTRIKRKDFSDFFFNPELNKFYCLGVLVRDSNGTWATVVTEKPENGKLKAKIAELETENAQLKSEIKAAFEQLKKYI